MPDPEAPDEKTPTVVGPAAEGARFAGLAPLPKWLDLDGNGLEDWKEPETWLKLMDVATSLITRLAPSNTVAHRYADYYRQNVLPRIDGSR